MKGNPRINGYVSTTNCRSPSSGDSRNKLNRVSPGLLNMLKNNISTSNQELIQTSLNGSFGKSKSASCTFMERNSSIKNYKDNPPIVGIDRCAKPHPTVQSHSITVNCNIKDTNKKKIKLPLRKKNIRATHHEMLQRIESKLDSFNHYQHHWFSSGLERLKLESMSREERLEITRYELNKQLNQIVKSEVGTDCCIPSSVLIPHGNNSNDNCSDNSRPYIGNGIGIGAIKHDGSSIMANNCHLERKQARLPPSPPPDLSSPTSLSRMKLAKCEYRINSGSCIIADADSNSTCLVDQCRRLALPSARHCASHITHNADQVLFTSCTAKFADNTQCSVPVFDIMHELPLCVEHARKRDNYKLNQETKPKKLRKKVKPSAMIRPQKRNKKKKKRSLCAASDRTMLTLKQGLLPENSLSENEELDRAMSLQEPVEPDLVELTQVVDQEALVTQATHLLEETDINTVLSTIHADEFNDLFSAVNRNGEYEPTREETEELERALAAVDNDVKSLEKLSQSHGLLDTFLDEHTLVESLVHIPDVFHGGQNGSFVTAVAGPVVPTVPAGGLAGMSGMPSLCSTAAAAALNASSSRLLSVQHHK